MAYSYRTLTDALSRAGIQEPAFEASLLLDRFAGVTYATLMPAASPANPCSTFWANGSFTAVPLP